MFGYVEAEESIAKSIEGMAGEEVNLRWQEFMGEYFEHLSRRPDQSMVPLEQVFYLE
jgi:L-rhamnose mutarotase